MLPANVSVAGTDLWHVYVFIMVLNVLISYLLTTMKIIKMSEIPRQRTHNVYREHY